MVLKLAHVRVTLGDSGHRRRHSRRKSHRCDRRYDRHHPETSRGYEGMPVQTIWIDIRQVSSRSNERTGYPTTKPLAPLNRIIKASSNEGDVVLDPFCGCVTTLVSVDRLGRNGIDISDVAVSLVEKCMREDQGLFQDMTARTDVLQRDDLGDLPPYNSPKLKNTLYGDQGGYCNGCGKHL